MVGVKYAVHTSIEYCSRLVDTLEVFLERNGLPGIKDFQDEFPDSITLAQSVVVWKHIVRYQSKLGTHVSDLLTDHR